MGMTDAAKAVAMWDPTKGKGTWGMLSKVNLRWGYFEDSVIGCTRWP